MLTVAISASVVLFIGILALKCVSAAQDVRVAHEELEERILLLKEVCIRREILRTVGEPYRRRGHCGEFWQKQRATYQSQTRPA